MKTLSKALKKVFPKFHRHLYETIKGPKRYHHLYDSITVTKAVNILEIGVWNGERAEKMINTAKKYNDKVSYYGFDLFEDLSEEEYLKEMSKKPPSKEYIQQKLSKTGASITLYSGDTHQSLPGNLDKLPDMDFIFIDGGHSNETVKNDWEYTSKLMNERTIVIFDDYWRNRTDGGSKLTVDSIDTEKYRVEILPEVDVFDNPDFGHLEISFAKVTKKS